MSKKEAKNKFKKFAILSLASVAGFVIFAFLHNLLSGALILIFKRPIEEPIFFLLAIIVAPIGFVVGVIGSLIQLIKTQKK